MTRHILKLAAVQTSKGRLAAVILINKYKAFREIDGGQSCIAAAKKFGVAKNTVSHWLKEYLNQLKETMSCIKKEETNEDCNIPGVGLCHV